MRLALLLSYRASGVTWTRYLQDTTFFGLPIVVSIPAAITYYQLRDLLLEVASAVLLNEVACIDLLPGYDTLRGCVRCGGDEDCRAKVGSAWTLRRVPLKCMVREAAVATYKEYMLEVARKQAELAAKLQYNRLLAGVHGILSQRLPGSALQR